MSDEAPRRYDRVARTLHWSMLLVLTAMFASAIAWNIDESYRSLVPMHKGFGILAMMLASVRLFWAWINAPQRPPVALPARLGHMALYALMMTVPVMALIREAGASTGTRAQRSPWMIALGDNWHGELAFVLLALVAGHVSMVIWHQFKGDGILRRML